MTTLTWGFESGFAEDSGSPLEVEDWAASPFDCTVTRSTAQAHSGSYSMLIEWTGDAYVSIAQVTLDVIADVEVSAWVYVPTGAAPVRLSVGQWTSTAYTTSSTNDAWEHLTLSATAEDFTTTGYGTILIQTVPGDRPTSTAYVDDVSITFTTSLLYPSVQSVSATVNQAITPTLEYVGLTGATYSISPTLIDGLSFDTDTGILSGTPTVVTGATTYTVTGTDGVNTKTATIFVTVDTPSISPATQSVSGIVGQPISPTTAYSGLDGATYSISPVPSSGLSFDTDTGILSGTPTKAGSTVYTVTATLDVVTATAIVAVTITNPTGLFNGITGPALYIQLWRRDLDPEYREWQSLNAGDVLEVSFRRGRSRPDFGYDAGVMTVVLDNASGQYDPDWSGSDWYPLLAAGTKFRLLATWDEVDYTLFTGFLESNQLDHGFAPKSTLTITDAISRISSIPTTAMSDALYDTEFDDEPVFDSSGVTPVGRLIRLVNAGLEDFLGTSAVVDVWDVPDDLLRKLTPIRKGANFTQILDECALVEGGIWYITKENRLGMYRADNKFDRPTRLWLSDSRADNTVEYDSLQVSPGAALLCNDARLSVPGRNGNDEQYWYQYSASASDFGIKSVQLSAPVYNTDWAQTLAKYYCRRYAEPKSYVSQIGFNAQALGVLYPDLLSCELADLLTVERTTVDGRTLTWNCVIESIEYQITSNSWRVAFNTSPVNGFYPSL